MYDIPILMLHTINDEPEKNPLGVLSVSQKGLDSYLKVFKNWKYQMISMDDLINERYQKDKPFVVLTFDDGYKDNLTVALPVLKKYGAKATIFINPSYTSNKTDETSDWGFMTWDEIKEAYASGIFDIQAHTMTHEFIFTSDKIVDYYTPDKFEKYYWLAWMLYPESPKSWDSSAMLYREKIPTGYPIFEYGRRLSSCKFVPSKEYINYLINQYNEGQIEVDTFDKEHGRYESKEEYIEYANWELLECKKVIEENLDNKVHTVCFPGGGYTEEVLKLAENVGYKCFMNASRLRKGNNNAHIKALQNGAFVGLNRTSFSLIHMGILPDHIYDYWIAKLSLASYQNKQPYTFLKKILASFLH